MMVHTTFLLSTFIASIKKNKKTCFILAFTILILFAMLRYDFGNDYMSYLGNDIQIRNNGVPTLTDLLFVALTKICPSFYVFVAVSSLISMIPIYYLIINYVDENYRHISLLIYCINPYLFLMSLSAIRQTLAAAFFIIAIHFSIKRRLIPYILCIIIASLFHKSALILFLFYFVANDKMVSRFQLTVAIAGLLVLVFVEGFFNLFVQLGLDFFKIPNYAYYASLRTGNSLRATLLSLVFLGYIMLNIRKMKGTTLAFTKLYLIGCMLSILAYRLSMFTRFQMYFDIFSVVSIPMIIKMNRSLIATADQRYRLINKYMFPILIFTIYILRYYSFFTNPMWESFTEYHTIFSQILN